MPGCLRKMVSRVFVLILLILAAYAGWRWGPDVFPRIEAWVGRSSSEAIPTVAPTPELASTVVAKVQALRRGEGSGRVALGDSEITSVLRYSVPGLVPAGVDSPEVRLEGDQVRLRARVALASFPDLPDLGPVLGILPDTVDAVLEGSVMPFGAGRAVLLVNGLEASRIPMPRRLIPQILTAIGRVQEAGLPPEALLIPLPSGVGTAYILGDSLILSNDS